MTPEGKVKKKVSELLRKVEGLYYWMPVPSGFGESTLDYVGCYCGLFFAIETKKPGGKPTDRQRITIEQIASAGGKTFVIDGDTEELEEWLKSLQAIRASTRRALEQL